MGEKSTQIKDLVKIPADYLSQNTHSGKIERLYYNTNTYDEANQNLEKYLNVYLPAGYDQNDTKTKYNVLYLMHGGGENQDTIFGGPDNTSELMNILDNMLYNGDIDPLIVVTPTFNTLEKGMHQATKDFQTELVKDVIPTVEGKYNTHAVSTSTNDLIAARNHRAFSGFSMGSACTWYAYIYCLDYFKYFMPLSGDCWAICDLGGRKKPQETAEYLYKVTKEYNYAPDQYYILCATGTDDPAYDNLVPQIEEMKKYDDTFIFTDDLSKGNFTFKYMQDATHCWNYVNQYIYSLLPYCFFK